MKRFILQSLWYVLPFAFLYVFTVAFYNQKSGDLIRMAHVPDYDKVYENKFESYYNLPTKAIEMQSLPKKKKYKLLIIGDSFAGQSNFGFKNQLAQHIDVLNIKDISWNPIETLSLLINGDFFDHFDIDYVLLQTVERAVPSRIASLDTTASISMKEIEEKMEKLNFKDQKRAETSQPENTFQEYKFFSNQALSFLWNTVKINVKKNTTLKNKVKKATLTENLFSVDNKSLLFFQEDLDAVSRNNTEKEVKQLNLYLNSFQEKLEDKNIQFMFMVAPDKYDFYYDFIKEAHNTSSKPVFFETFRKLPKNYLYIDSKQILTPFLTKEKDLYYFGDTHWSPISSEIIADSILSHLE